MRYSGITPQLFIRNRARLLKRLKPQALAILHSNDEMPRNGDQTYVFRQNSDMFYLTGLDQEKSILTICPNHPVEALREIIFVVKTNDLMVTWYGHKYTLEQASELSGVKTAKWLDEFDSTLKDLMSRAEYVYLNQNENIRFSTEVLSRDLRFAQKLRNDYPLHAFERLAPLVNELRTIKEPEELGILQKACDITGLAFRRILGFVKPGVLEYEIEAEITHEFIRNGASGHAYAPIIASGTNACILHYNENDKPCNNGDLILLDFGAEYGNYAADLSRTIPANGKFTPRQRQVYDAVLRVMRKATKMLVPDTTIDKWHAEVCRIMEKELIGLGLFTEEDIKAQDAASPMFFNYYMHGTGHFLGLDVHDVGSKQMPLQEGMVLTCEPGIYIREEGIGIRLENDIMVAQEPVDLMAGIPLDPDEIEVLMAK
ncbi:MAG: aminopeptidase P N-terminal domain-containing protein [Bacteroidales bacterium]